jgi:hypothetical protein
MPRLAMAPKAVPLMSKCAAWARQTPPGQESVIVTVTGHPEQALLPVHLIFVLCSYSTAQTTLVSVVRRRMYVGEYTPHSTWQVTSGNLIACAAAIAVLEKGRTACGYHRRERALADRTLIAARTACMQKRDDHQHRH